MWKVKTVSRHGFIHLRLYGIEQASFALESNMLNHSTALCHKTNGEQMDSSNNNCMGHEIIVRGQNIKKKIALEYLIC